ncbi:MAG: hypothetical protein LBU06_06530 [Desulfovibrio sp.]|jgi:uncharacterized cupin superfamily protein|nr:hypothetical protein [Desulfovibrio sp.]
MKPILTSLDINAAKKAGRTEITLPENALVTLQALDDAKACGISIKRAPSPIRDAACKACAGEVSPPGEPDAGEQGALIGRLRQKIAERLGKQADAASIDKAIRAALSAQTPHIPNPDGPAPSLSDTAFTRHAGGLTHIRKNALPEAVPKGETPFPEAVNMIEACPPTDAAPGIAYMSWENSSFSWTCAHAEVLVVLAGEISVAHAGTEFTASPGDALHIAAGGSLTLASGGKAVCLLNSWPATGQCSNPQPAPSAG